MSAVIEVNILCRRIINWDIVEELFSEHCLHIEAITSMENWLWENEQTINSISQIESEINKHRIIRMILKSPGIENLGIFIQKEKSYYYYNVWLDTSICEALDSDVVTNENRAFYEGVYQIISKIDQKTQSGIDVVGVGVETSFYLSENAFDVMCCSKNIASWILRYENGINQLETCYMKKRMEGCEMLILEKRNNYF